MPDPRKYNLPAPRAAPKLAGHVIVTFDDGAEFTYDTVQCCHCFKHWRWVVGSGRKRGWCDRCSGFTCGCQRCDVCVPKEQWLENSEAGLAPELRRTFRPTRVGGFHAK